MKADAWVGSLYLCQQWFPPTDTLESARSIPTGTVCKTDDANLVVEADFNGLDGTTGEAVSDRHWGVSRRVVSTSLFPVKDLIIPYNNKRQL